MGEVADERIDLAQGERGGGLPLDAPERPAQLPKCENLLPFVVAQDVGHAGERDHNPSRRVNVLSAYSLWPVLRCRPMAGFGCRPRTDEQLSCFAVDIELWSFACS